MKYKDRERVIVNTGGKDIYCNINTETKAAHGVYWEEQDCYSILFDNATKQYIPSKYIKRIY